MKARYSARAVRNQARLYRGPANTPIPPETSTDVTTNDDTSRSIDCPSCGARVMRLVTGNAKAHAPGGLSTNTRRGRFKCPGSGNDGTPDPA